MLLSADAKSPKGDYSIYHQEEIFNVKKQKQMLTYHKIKDLETEYSIQFIKHNFLGELRRELNLHQVFAPLYLKADTGINDDLNGIERPVTFTTKQSETPFTIVHSLAKWKRLRLKELNVPPHEGIVTNMIALRPDEVVSNLHSVFVDQWDWEMHITQNDRTIDFLKRTVTKIYEALKQTETAIAKQYPNIVPVLPSSITFIHAEDLLNQFPNKSVKEREDIIVSKYGAVFLIGIGNKLVNGAPHDSRAPDYDDWSTPTSTGHFGLNGDILLWHPVLRRSFEVSSMGIRVDAMSLKKQLSIAGAEDRAQYDFHKLLMTNRLPLSIGGGIGQSRVCMFMLRKGNIREVQCIDG